MTKASRERRFTSAHPGASPDAPETKTCAVCATEHPVDAATCKACGEASWIAEPPEEAA
jgi:hypothetical protein